MSALDRMTAPAAFRARRALFAATLACLTLCSTGATAQESWPSRPINLLSPFDAGSQPDMLARAFAEGLREVLGKPVVVQNRVGASGTLAVEAVARAQADGHTLGFGPPGQFTVQPKMRANFPYAMQDFEFLCQTNSTVFVIAAGPKTPYASLGDVIEAARRSPGTINVGSAGHATFPHLVIEWIASNLGVSFNTVQFKNVGDMVIQLANGSIDVMASTAQSAVARPDFKPLLAVGEQRPPRLPSVPLAREAGFEVPPLGAAVGLYAPRGLPAAVSRALRDACARIVTLPGMKTVADSTGTPILHRDGPAYAKLLEDESRAVGGLIERVGGAAK